MGGTWGDRGGRGSQEKGTVCAKALPHVLGRRPSDSHTQGLSPSFNIWLFELLWETHFAIFNGYTHIEDVKDNNYVNKNLQVLLLQHIKAYWQPRLGP